VVLRLEDRGVGQEKEDRGTRPSSGARGDADVENIQDSSYGVVCKTICSIICLWRWLINIAGFQVSRGIL
jgi:hypothetical protein